MLDTSNIPKEELPKAMYEEATTSWTEKFNSLIYQITIQEDLARAYEYYIKNCDSVIDSNYYDQVFQMTTYLITINEGKLKTYRQLLNLLRCRPKEVE